MQMLCLKSVHVVNATWLNMFFSNAVKFKDL